MELQVIIITLMVVELVWGSGPYEDSNGCNTIFWRLTENKLKRKTKSNRNEKSEKKQTSHCNSLKT